MFLQHKPRYETRFLDKTTLVHVNHRLYKNMDVVSVTSPVGFWSSNWVAPAVAILAVMTQPQQLPANPKMGKEVDRQWRWGGPGDAAEQTASS